MNAYGSKWIRPEKRLAIYIRDNFTCVYCGRMLKNDSKDNVTLDHLTPRKYHGTNGATNLVTACRACNCSRQEKSWVDYATGGAVERIMQLRYEPLNVSLAKALIDGTADNDDVEGVR
jgi:5-methylcytosine-specific restriction endonuclease McrA